MLRSTLSDGNGAIRCSGGTENAKKGLGGASTITAWTQNPDEPPLGMSHVSLSGIYGMIERDQRGQYEEF